MPNTSQGSVAASGGIFNDEKNMNIRRQLTTLEQNYRRSDSNQSVWVSPCTLGGDHKWNVDGKKRNKNNENMGELLVKQICC